MLPIGLAWIIVVQYLILGSLLGGFCGAIVRFVFRIRWRAVVFVQDVAIAGVALIVCAAASILLGPLHGPAHEGAPFTFLLIGPAAVVALELIRFFLLRRRRISQM